MREPPIEPTLNDPRAEGITTFGFIEVLRCMCGKHPCQHCGMGVSSTCAIFHDAGQLQRIVHCPHCGMPQTEFCR